VIPFRPWTRQLQLDGRKHLPVRMRTKYLRPKVKTSPALSKGNILMVRKQMTRICFHTDLLRAIDLSL
jgi:hypothetical protein